MSKNSKNFLTGKFIKRYKRFFVDVQLDSKKIVTAHCPNTGSMMGLLEKDKAFGRVALHVESPHLYCFICDLKCSV